MAAIITKQELRWGNKKIRAKISSMENNKQEKEEEEEEEEEASRCNVISC